MRLLSETEGVKCIAPLDIILKIDDLPFKMTREMMCEVAFWGQNQSSYKAASEIVNKTRGVSISHETIRAITDYTGKIIFDQDTALAESTYKCITQNEFSERKTGILYIQADGAAVNTRIKNEEGSTWRENKLGIVFSSDNIKKSVNKKGESTSEILKKEHTSYIGSAQEFKKYLLACAKRNGYGSYKETVILSDGAKWIKNIGDECFPDAVQVLDLFHLCENTYSYAKAIFKNDETMYKPWATEIIEKLKDSKTQEVLQILKAFKDRKLPKGTVDLYIYIENNIDRVDYKAYKEKDYYVGSGVIESGNKVVLQKRLKLAGMRWDPLAAQYLLSLRAKYESGLWMDGVVMSILKYDFSKMNHL